jgi:hypothetical protein
MEDACQSVDIGCPTLGVRLASAEFVERKLHHLLSGNRLVCVYGKPPPVCWFQARDNSHPRVGDAQFYEATT